MTTPAKQTKRTASVKAVPPARGRRVNAAGIGQLCRDYGLSRPILARMLGVPQATLAKWEWGADQPNAAGGQRIERVKDILKGFARVMRKDYLPTWVANPNDAAKEAGARTPLDLMEQGDYASIAQMIYFFEAGEPF